MNTYRNRSQCGSQQGWLKTSLTYFKGASPNPLPSYADSYSVNVLQSQPCSRNDTSATRVDSNPKSNDILWPSKTHSSLYPGFPLPSWTTSTYESAYPLLIPVLHFWLKPTPLALSTSSVRCDVQVLTIALFFFRDGRCTWPPIEPLVRGAAEAQEGDVVLPFFLALEGSDVR